MNHSYSFHAGLIPRSRFDAFPLVSMGKPPRGTPVRWTEQSRAVRFWTLTTTATFVVVVNYFSFVYFLKNSFEQDVFSWIIFRANDFGQRHGPMISIIYYLLSTLPKHILLTSKIMLYSRKYKFRF